MERRTKNGYNAYVVRGEGGRKYRNVVALNISNSLVKDIVALRKFVALAIYFSLEHQILERCDISSETIFNQLTVIFVTFVHVTFTLVIFVLPSYTLSSFYFLFISFYSIHSMHKVFVKLDYHNCRFRVL